MNSAFRRAWPGGTDESVGPQALLDSAGPCPAERNQDASVSITFTRRWYQPSSSGSNTALRSITPW